MCQIFKVHAEAIATVIQFSLNELSSIFLDFFQMGKRLRPNQSCEHNGTCTLRLLAHPNIE